MSACGHFFNHVPPGLAGSSFLRMRSSITAILAVFIVLSGSAQFQEKEHPQDTLRTRYLDEVVIAVNKNPELRRFVAQQVKIITPSTIINLNAQSTADLLSNTGVVAMQKSQQGGGSPILRGFEASRVLLVIDGIRMNNLIYRAGHLQNVITLDNNSLDRAEVLFGPSSTVYGSDALGGAIHFFTRDPKLQRAGHVVSGNTFVRLGSVNDEKTFHGELNLAGKKIASLTTFNISDFGDLKMGARKNPAFGESFGLRDQYVTRAADNQSDQLTNNPDPLVQRSSGYRQTDVMQKVLLVPSERISHLFALQYSTSSDIPRYDRLTDPGTGSAGLKFAQWYYGPQQRVLAYYRLQVNDLGKWADRMTATVSNQWIEESRHQRRFNSTSLQHRYEDVGVTGVTVDFQKRSGKDEFRYGIDGQFNRLKSTAHAEDILTRGRTPLDTRYPDGDNTMNFQAVYLTHTRRLSEHLTLNDGVRAGVSRLVTQFSDKRFFPFPYDDVRQNNFTGSTSVGLVYTPGNWKLSVLAGTGFRSPNVDDLAKVFESVAGSGTTTGTLIVPNPDLKPEKTINLDLGVTKFIGTTTRIEGTFFATNMTDAIITKAFALDGQATVTYNGFPANVFANQNAARALITGAIVQLRSDLTERWNITASWNHTKGRVINKDAADTPLDHIAPNFGRAGIQYTGSKLRGELFSNFSGWKRLKDYSQSGEDNLQYATVKGMPSWWTVNLRLSAEVSKTFTLQAGIDNILDLQYRTFASSINAPGRNFFVTGRLKF